MKEAEARNLKEPTHERGPSPEISPTPGIPSRSGKVILGRTLPSLMDEACERNPNPKAFNQPTKDGWISVSTQEFCSRSESMALGLLGLGLARGDRVGLFMESNLHFCVADMACLIAGLIDVPIYLTHAPSAIRFVLQHTEARALVLTHLHALETITPFLGELPQLKTIVVVEAAEEDLWTERARLPTDLQLISVDEVLTRGRVREEDKPGSSKELKSEIHAQDLATIVYTSGTTGTPKGVMLTHENISFNVLASFSRLVGLEPQLAGVVISFLPLSHSFARTIQYGFLNYGYSVYFTTPDSLAVHLKEIKPTIFAAVPRVLDKLYDRILEAGGELRGIRKSIFQWGLRTAQIFELGKKPSRFYSSKYAIVDRLVYSKWRAALGGRLEFVVCGGAPLRADLVNIFAAAGVNVLQGYGLTETSPIISCNLPETNRAGTVGAPLVGVEVAIAEDGEILTRGPHVMRGYYRNPQATGEVVDEKGWFHTGDVGEFTSKGLLKVTDRKKDLFKLSTGKYVMPQLLESRLQKDSLVEHAVVVGAGRKFCAALIFPDSENLKVYSRRKRLDSAMPAEELLKFPAVTSHFETLVEESNADLPHWSTIKRFKLVANRLTIENGMLTPTLKVRRAKVRKTFAEEISHLYTDSENESQEEPSTG
ncbi:MAG: AMP-dependent synthetase/ligase [Acidobacteriota bacterium]